MYFLQNNISTGKPEFFHWFAILLFQYFIHLYIFKMEVNLSNQHKFAQKITWFLGRGHVFVYMCRLKWASESNEINKNFEISTSSGLFENSGHASLYFGYYTRKHFEKFFERINGILRGFLILG